MPIRIEQYMEDVFSDVIMRPKIFCDHCDGVIDKEHPGNYEFNPANEDVLFFIHKKCSRAHMKKIGYRTMWCDIKALPVYLLMNMGYTFKEADKTARLLAFAYHDGSEGSKPLEM